MTTPPTGPDLLGWNVEFAEYRFPAVSVLSDDYGETVLIVVAPAGFSAYPKYLVRFRNVVTLLYYEETCSIDRGYESLTRSHSNLCAYRWVSSPWLKQYRVLEDIIFNKSPDKLHHYLILGGDTIVEVIALGEAAVEKINSKRVIEVTLEV
jgi:hypothetical protein